MRDFRAPSLKCDIFIKPLPQGSGIYSEKETERLKKKTEMISQNVFQKTTITITTKQRTDLTHI